MQPLALNHMCIVSCAGSARTRRWRPWSPAIAGCSRAISRPSRCPPGPAKSRRSTTFGCPPATPHSIAATTGWPRSRWARMALPKPWRGRSSGMARRGSACSSAPARRASCRPSRHSASRDPDTGQLPAGFHYAETHNTGSLAAYLRARLGSVRAGVRGLLRLRLLGQGVRPCGADDRGRTVRCGDRRRRRLAVPDDAVRLPCAEPERARPVPPVRRARATASRSARRRVSSCWSGLGDDGRDSVQLLGVGESNDAHHMSSPHPEGAGARLAMQRALASAAVTPADIDYINLHGTATRVGDSAEDLAVFSLFGETTRAQFHQGPHRSHAWRRGHRRGDHFGAGDPPRSAARQSAHRNDRSGVPRPLSTDSRAGAGRPRAEQLVRLRRQQLQPGTGPGALISVFVEGIGIAGPGLDGWAARGPCWPGWRRTSPRRSCRGPSRCCRRPSGGAPAARSGWPSRVGSEALATPGAIRRRWRWCSPRPAATANHARDPVRARDRRARGIADPLP